MAGSLIRTVLAFLFLAAGMSASPVQGEEFDALMGEPGRLRAIGGRPDGSTGGV